MNLVKLDSAKGNRDQHFANLNLYLSTHEPAETMEGKFWEIDESIYDEFLEMLPPIYVPNGFMMIEALTDTDHGAIRTYFTRFSGAYWCGDCTRDSVTVMWAAMVEANAAMDDDAGESCMSVVSYNV